MLTRSVFAVVPALVLLSGTAFAQAGDAAAGEKVFNQCKACHTLEQGKHRVGPSLHGVVGRKAGGAEGFKYSDAMMKSAIEWTPENIDKYLADPKGFIPGNKMAFAGLKKDDDRKNVIAYLQKQGGGAK
jgi:cytochrome c